MAEIVSVRANIRELDLSQVVYITLRLVPFMLNHFLAENVVDLGRLFAELVGVDLILLRAIIYQSLPTIIRS